MPFVSIILPIFNEDCLHLEQCLQSIRSQLLQEWECILILESTTNENKLIIEKICSDDHRFRVEIPEIRLGLPASLNLGVKLASSELIARMDSDDRMTNDRLLEQVKFMEYNKNVSAIGSFYKKIDEEGRYKGIRRYPLRGFSLMMYFVFRCGLAHPTVMFRKSDFFLVGGYNESLKYCEDLDLWLRYIRRGFKLENINKILIDYRISKRSFKHWLQMVKLRFRHLMWLLKLSCRIDAN